MERGRRGGRGRGEGRVNWRGGTWVEPGNIDPALLVIASHSRELLS